MNKKGFTLAEVFITLGIIGIVAAMTLPTLIGKYQEKVTMTKVKKAYSILSQVYQKAQIDNGGLKAYEWTPCPSNNCISYKLKPYFKLLKACSNNKEECTKLNTVKTLSGNLFGGNLWNNNLLQSYEYTVLADGTIILFEPIAGNIYILTENKKNLIFNKNLFHLVLGKNGKVETMACGRSSNPMDLYNGTKGNGCPPSAVDWILAYNNMDYLHCAEKMHTLGTHSCK